MKAWVFLLFSFFLSADLYAEMPALQKAVEKEFAGTEGGILIVKAQTGDLLASYQYSQLLDHNYPPGSLIKVFTVISYYRYHTMAFPKFLCPATLPSDPDGCWDRNGHGKVDILRALGYSCNVYFRQLAQDVSPEVFRDTLKAFDLLDDETTLSTLPESVQRKLMVGNTNEWSVSPLLMLRAYCAIFNGGHLWVTGSHPAGPLFLPEELRELIRRGMMLSAQKGTSLPARRIAGVPLLGKTGTTLKWENERTDWTATQGWWIGLYPTDQPEVAILVFAPGGRGALDAAPRGGKALALYLQATHRR